MKTSAVLASALLSAFAVAAPVDKRALVYHTEIVTETVVVYTTIYDDDYVPKAEATSTSEGRFYQQPAANTSSSVVVPSSKAAPAPSSKAQEPSSVYTLAPQTSTPAAVVTPTPTPEQSSQEAKPTTTETPYVASSPAPVATSAAPVVASPVSVVEKPASTGSTTSGESFSDVDITIYDNNGGYGACGTALYDTDMIVALAQPAWGASTYDVQTGAATNPWCGQKIQIEYNGNSVEATIMDLCPGCSGHDIDLSLATWKALTGLDEKTRLQASWSKIS